MEITNFTDYRQYLKAELNTRSEKNASYSLRAFARDLDFLPQVLSLVLNGKKGISVEKAALISEKLSHDIAEASYFQDLVTLAHSKNQQAQKISEFRINQQRQKQNEFSAIDVESFKVIADWYHAAIIELTETNDFKYDINWIAEKLNITQTEAKQAIARLIKINILIEQDNKIKKTQNHFFADYKAPNSALRKLSKQLLSKAIIAVDEQSFEEKDITNITMAIDPKLLPAAEEKIKNFRRELCSFLESGSNRTEVYTFIPALFKLTKNRKR
jgi:uncharacterized protein (TIGR02147 family)